MVSKRKLYDKESVCRFKAPLMVKRCFLKKGVGYSEIFAAVVPFEVLLLPVEKFSLEEWSAHHVDNSTAFLNEDIDGEVYVS